MSSPKTLSKIFNLLSEAFRKLSNRSHPHIRSTIVSNSIFLFGYKHFSETLGEVEINSEKTFVPARMVFGALREKIFYSGNELFIEAPKHLLNQ